MSSRPLGVAILSVLSIIGGIIYVVGGVVLFSLGGFLISFFLIEGNVSSMNGIPFTFMGLLQGLMMVVSIIVIIIGIMAILVGYGLWTGKEWARILTIVFSIFGIIFGIFTLPTGIIVILIDVIIIWYLTRPHVVDWFRGVHENI